MESYIGATLEFRRAIPTLHRCLFAQWPCLDSGPGKTLDAIVILSPLRFVIRLLIYIPCSSIRLTERLAHNHRIWACHNEDCSDGENKMLRDRYVDSVHSTTIDFAIYVLQYSHHTSTRSYHKGH